MRRPKLNTRMQLNLFLIIPSTLFLLVVVFLSYHQTNKFVNQTQNQALNGLVKQVVVLIENQKNDIVLNMLEIEKMIKDPQKSKSDLEESMTSMARIRTEMIRGIVYIDIKDSITGYPEIFWDNFADKEIQMIHNQTKNHSFNTVWSEPFNSEISTMGPINCLVTKEIRDDNGNVEGVLAFVIDMTYFLQRSAAYAGSYDTQTLLYDRNDRLIYSITIVAQNPIEKLNYTDVNTQTVPIAREYFKKTGKYFVESAMEQAPNWKVVVVGDVKKLEDRYKPIAEVGIAVGLLGILGLIFIHIFVSWTFTRPILTLTHGVRRVGKGDLNHRFEIKRQDEFGELALEFNRMMNKVEELIITLKAAEEQKYQSDFQILISQINPHFLYNTLNTIDIMIDFSPKQELHQVMAVLISLLKYGLDLSSDHRPLIDELTHVKDYLTIQSIRYENRFEVDLEDPGALAEIHVLKLILQPIAENAVFHGLHSLEGRKGKLTIAVTSQGADLWIKVMDNGVGMNEIQLKQLRELLHQPVTSQVKGIGIYNVHRRIQLYYGSEYGLTVDSTQNLGTTITIRLKK